MDGTEASFGDIALYGVNAKLPASALGQGLVAHGRNVRFRNGVAETRRGRFLPPWANQIVPVDSDFALAPWVGPVRGVGVFGDPNSRQFIYLVEGSTVHRLLEDNGAAVEPLPAGTAVNGEVTFTQAFNKLFLWRGRYQNPLVLSTVDSGFVDLIQHRSAVTSFVGGDLFLDGPWVSVSSLTRSSTTATVTAAAAHGLVTGQSVLIRGATPAGYNVRAVITVTSETAFTFATDGSLTTPATGTIEYSPMENAWEVQDGGGTYAPETAVSGITRVGTTATATVAATTGLSNGDSVVIRGANQDAYNGVFTVSNKTGTTFDFTVANSPTTPATGTISSARVIRRHTAMPNGFNATFLNNRLLVPTSFVPGSSTTVAGSYTAKRDYVACSDVQAYQTFNLSNEFRINQGASDELMALAKLGPSSVVCLKSGSVGLLDGVSGTLSGITFQVLIANYGLVNPHAWALVGKDVVFVSPRRGVVSLGPTTNGPLQGVEVPLSDPMDPVIRRINWSLGDRIRVAYCDSKLYVAVPLDAGECLGWDRINHQRYNYDAISASYLLYLSGPGSDADLKIGETYEWTPAGDSDETLNLGGTTYTQRARFVYDGSVAYLRWRTGGLAARSTLRTVRSGVNNAVLVYDYTAPTTPGDDPSWRRWYPSGQWQGYDDGPELSVRHFVVARWGGRDLLYAAYEDGFVGLYEFLEWDQVRGPNTSGTQLQEIEAEIHTRAYVEPLRGRSQLRHIEAVLGTWRPQYTATVALSSLNTTRTLCAEKTKDRTKYAKPCWKPRYDERNINGDSEDPGREDYSVVLTSGGSLTVPTSGTTVFAFQECTERWSATGIPGRTHQLRIKNRTGLLQLREVRGLQEADNGRKGTFA